MTKKDPTAEKFLLYIDILGFTEMALKEPRKVDRIFATINSLNVQALEQGEFALSSLVNDSWFAGEVKTMERDIRDFKQIRKPQTRH